MFIYIHGGTFDGGSAMSVAYNGERLAKKGNMITVVIEYRLGRSIASYSITDLLELYIIQFE